MSTTLLKAMTLTQVQNPSIEGQEEQNNPPTQSCRHSRAATIPSFSIPCVSLFQPRHISATIAFNFDKFEKFPISNHYQI
ncbi:hypothetical protein ACFX1S_043999 [Malus domestica]